MISPLVRKNMECGTDAEIWRGRQASQMGWYRWIGERFCKGRTVLDVGAGMCEGLKVLKDQGAAAVMGQDIDERLKAIEPDLILEKVEDIETGSFDVVTALDVIEHVVEDHEFFYHLMRIAREFLIITTPNYAVSKAANHFHCREYTIHQFVEFEPDELWLGSPSGEDVIKVVDGPYSIGPWLRSDGYEWPHICGVWHFTPENLANLVNQRISKSENDPETKRILARREK